MPTHGWLAAQFKREAAQVKHTAKPGGFLSPGWRCRGAKLHNRPVINSVVIVGHAQMLWTGFLLLSVLRLSVRLGMLAAA